MDIETFEKILHAEEIPDEQVKTAFNLLVAEVMVSNPEMVNTALKLLGKYRPEIGGKIATEILSYTPNKQIEEAFNLFAKNKEWHSALLIFGIFVPK